ncbi:MULTISPECIES: hypothetical protein [unclassified Streptomyces]|uniref:hypothetical protein n=1 Tax=unclassified Streptomyces TaxID=2593676 RepID=UPI002E81A794|nr:hypothetical protein [Streptomyces sp. NBC_00589]WTI38928.1 hypothetical protein OIC96_30085 [Streptomyces sp. NBC_00775]WUB27392.1 hypothetical protein OHA51_19650 [Streptomyces sp. NBC_00589]
MAYVAAFAGSLPGAPAVAAGFSVPAVRLQGGTFAIGGADTLAYPERLAGAGTDGGEGRGVRSKAKG